MKYYHSYILLLLLSCLSGSLSAQAESKSSLAVQKEEAARSKKIMGEPNIELELKDARSLTKATVLPVQSVAVHMEPVGTVDLDPEKMQDSNPQDLLASQEMRCNLLIDVFNPATIARIHVKLGAAEGKSNFVSHAFEFDRAAPVPFHYARDGKTIVLSLGKYTNMGPCTGQVILEHLNGKRSAPHYFSAKG
ncbi:MAG: hypothetical protein AAGG75_23200 [Bacteroidota bacterium]